MPVHCNVLYSTREEALHTPRGDIKLGFCQKCTHIFNTAFNPALMKYVSDYENSLNFSPRFQQYARSLASRLIERYHLYDKDVIEIGCGKGDFLRLLCNLGRNRGIGFDPSYENERSGTGSQQNVTFIQDFYSERYSSYKADLVCCRHVLEHIQFPADLLGDLSRIVADKPEVIIFFEVPNSLFIFRDLSIWDIIYEHCGYFSPGSLEYLFTACRLKVSVITETFENQFLCVESLPSNDLAVFRSDHTDNARGTTHYISMFSESYRKKVERWLCEFDTHNNSGKRTVVWGGGSKGATFLNILKLDQVEYVVDVNLRKQGKYIPGTGQKVVSPEFLKDYQPEIVIVMNPIYLNEIADHLRNLTISARILRG